MLLFKFKWCFCVQGWHQAAGCGTTSFKYVTYLSIKITISVQFESCIK